MQYFKIKMKRWKNISIVSVVVTMVMMIVILSVSISVIHDSIEIRRAAQMAVGTPIPHPPPIEMESPQAPQGKHTLDPIFARYASDLVARIEAENMGSPPSHLESLEILDTQTGKNNAWILRDSGRNRVWIVFRGTATKDEWEKNFELKQVPFVSRLLDKNISRLAYPQLMEHPQVPNNDLFPEEQVKVHSGFVDIYTDIRDQIAGHVSNVDEICIAGHSLGGALAQITAYDLANLAPGTPISTVVFGCPRVGNDHFASNLVNLGDLNHLVMVTNTCDLVTDIPLAVQPVLKAPNTPMFYTHPSNTTHQFTDNRGTWIENHMIGVYTDYLDSIK
jgi:hypothetical protein